MKTRLERREHRSGLLFVAPLIAVLVLVAGWPLARTLYFSLTDAYLDDSANHVLVGFSNFVEVAGDRSCRLPVQRRPMPVPRPC